MGNLWNYFEWKHRVNFERNVWKISLKILERCSEGIPKGISGKISGEMHEKLPKQTGEK